MKKSAFIIMAAILASCTKQQTLSPTPASSGIITTIAGDGISGYSGDGGAATAAEISLPASVAADNAGNVYIADNINNVIRRVNTAGIISTIAGNGQRGHSGDDGPAIAAELNKPTGVAVDNSGNIYIADADTYIRKVSTSGIITTIAGNPSGVIGEDGGPAVAAKLGPSSVAADNSGNVYIADDNCYRICKVNTSGIINTVAGRDSMYYGGDMGDGGPATAASLSEPIGVAADNTGNVYIAVSGNLIRKVSPSGIITTIAGGGNSLLGNGEPATAAKLDYVSGVAVDNSGDVYIALSEWEQICKVNTMGIITTIAGDGDNNFFTAILNGTAIVGGYSGDGGPATAAELNNPGGVAIDASGNVYISDNSNFRIRKVSQ